MNSNRKNRARKGLLGSLLTLCLATGVSAYGTFAYFNDTETSSANLFGAGTLDLVVGGADDVNAFISGANFAPGDAVTGSITLTNAGSISSYDGNGHAVALAIDVTLQQTDADGVTTDMADFLELTTLSYDGASLLASVTDANANGLIDLGDLETASLTGLADPGSAGKVLDLAVNFHPSAGNALQGDSVNVAFEFVLEQA